MEVSRVEIDDKFNDLKLHSKDVACLMTELKEKGFKTICPFVIVHTSMESVITSNVISW